MERERECCNCNTNFLTLPRACFSLSLWHSPCERESATFLPGPFVLNFRGWQRKNLPVVLIQQMLFLLLHTHCFFHTNTHTRLHHTVAHTHTHSRNGSLSPLAPAFLFYLAFSLRFLHLSRCLLFMLFRSLLAFILLLPLFSTQTNRDGGREWERDGAREWQTQTTNKQQLAACGGARRRESITVDKRVKKRQNINNNSNNDKRRRGSI